MKIYENGNAIRRLLSVTSEVPVLVKDVDFMVVSSPIGRCLRAWFLSKNTFCAANDGVVRPVSMPVFAREP